MSPKIREELSTLCVLDNVHGPLGLLADYAVVAIAILLSVKMSWLLYPVSLVLIGSSQRALVNVLHEASHGNLARNRTWNLVLGTVFSAHLVLHLFLPYCSSHICQHHRFLGDREKDPDYSFHIECGLYDPTRSNGSFFFRNVVLATIGGRTLAYLRYVVEDRFLFRQEQSKVSAPISMAGERCLIAAVWAAILAVLAATGLLWALLLFWFVPLFTTAVAIGWLSELAEHYPLLERETDKILMTRNRHGWGVERFLFGRHKDNLHLVHHLNTRIPFWNLKNAHRILLRDPAYAQWDGMWAGIVTRSRRSPGRETVVSYAAKYRDWRRAGSDQPLPERTFALSLCLSDNDASAPANDEVQA